MANSQIDRLDEIARALLQPESRSPAFDPLSTGERLYVALAANRHDLLKEDDYTIVQALTRIGAEWMVELINRWRYA